jgi:hypothetical protein
MPAALWPRASLLRRSLFWKILLAFWLTLLLAGVGAGLMVQSGLQHAQGILAAAIGQEYLGFADGVDAPGALDAQASLPASPHPIQAERGK